MNKKISGILIHPTSFPGKYGCGDLGEGAYRVIDLLKRYDQKILQILPLNPTGYADSPYSSFSAFAGTPYIISFDELIEKGYLKKSDLKDYPNFEPNRVDYGGIYVHNFKILRIAYKRFLKTTQPDSYAKFCKENGFWLNDYALFMAIKDSKNGASWDIWEEDLRLRKNLSELSKEILDDAEFYKFLQWEFYEQWTKFKKYANDNGIMIIGDAPIFVAYDSSDVWANQNLFHLDSNGKPTIVTGVPPDYFSKTGQLWGSPHYKWDVMLRNDFDWWKKRISYLLKLVDCIRIDHFRGFEAYWEVKYGEQTAINGRWVNAPGKELFNSIKKEFGSERLKTAIIAEDLGIITKEVEELRDYFEFPGMRIFEFAPFNKGTFTDAQGVVQDNSKAPYLPENYINNCVAYPGTHDNDVIHGWFFSQSESAQNDILKYLGIKNKITWSDSLNDLTLKIEDKLLNSEAKWVVFLMQDVLGLTSESRMNTPGTSGVHNWSWRLTDKMIEEKKGHLEALQKLTKKSGRK
ncbi:MAG: 4-alpha-glucanotransferase [Spirochaetes bacterium]|nr:4-alpha-glucanotransferase [Spirochaetota bacterium]